MEKNKNERLIQANFRTLPKEVKVGVIFTRINPDNGNVEIYLEKQVRPPYIHIMDEEDEEGTYGFCFMELITEDVNDDEVFEDAIERRADEEFDCDVEWITPLIIPAVYHDADGSATATKLYVAGVRAPKDLEKGSMTNWYPAFNACNELEDYMEGEVDTFCGVHISETTILGLSRFFVKLYAEDFEYLNRHWNKELKERRKFYVGGV